MRARLIASLIALSLPLGAVASAGAPAPRPAPTDAAPTDADARFEGLLKAIDVLADRAGLDRAWPDARERLLRAAGEVDRDDWTRIRAVAFLSFYPDAGVREALLALADAPRVEVRRMALYTAARTFGAPGDPALVAAVERALGDDAISVREHAVRSLRWIDHPAAGRALARVEAGERPELRELARLTTTRRAQRLASPRR